MRGTTGWVLALAGLSNLLMACGDSDHVDRVEQDDAAVEGDETDEGDEEDEEGQTANGIASFELLSNSS